MPVGSALLIGIVTQAVLVPDPSLTPAGPGAG